MAEWLCDICVPLSLTLEGEALRKEIVEECDCGGPNAVRYRAALRPDPTPPFRKRHLSPDSHRLQPAAVIVSGAACGNQVFPL